MNVDLKAIEEAAKELYIRALKVLPPDIKSGFQRLSSSETGATAQKMLSTMITNIKVAEWNTAVRDTCSFSNQSVWRLEAKNNKGTAAQCARVRTLSASPSNSRNKAACE